MSDNDDDREDRNILGLVIGIAVVIAIAVSLLTGLGAASMFSGKPATQTVAAPPAAAPAAASAPAVAPGNIIVGPAIVYFETGKTESPADTVTVVAEVVEAVKSGRADKAVISGFHDRTGNVDLNAELSKQRAVDVARILGEAGLTAAQIELRKPAETTGDGTNREARRVEITAEKN